MFQAFKEKVINAKENAEFLAAKDEELEQVKNKLAKYEKTLRGKYRYVYR